MVTIIGFDVGGVNIKCALLEYSSETDYNLRVLSKFYPIWLHDRDLFPQFLEEVIFEISHENSIDLLVFTFTAEVSDAFYTKREGVNFILSTFKTILPSVPKRVISTSNRFVTIDEALADYMAVASANWVATALFVGKKFPTCLLIDIGSTTTDIIPIQNGRPITIGKTDTDRLLYGELVYTGALRATIPSIAHSVPINDSDIPISFEKFALMADVHLILDHIDAAAYTCDTADGRAKTKKDAFARLARIICSDLDLISKDQLYSIAQFLYTRQLDHILHGLQKVLKNHPTLKLTDPVVVTGLGRNFLAKKAAETLGFHRIIDLDAELGKEGAIAAPAAAITFLALDKLKEH
ncbi:MAG: hydantoinase/oxoprolinase family protein [Candidatus Helarchaeota archaeon]